jgi:hypothetical protein
MSRPLFMSGCLLLGPDLLLAQDPLRPWLPWRTISTQHYRFHFPAEMESWTRHIAERVESVDSTINRLVGFTAGRSVHVVVDDPFGVPNGYALPFIDRPATVLWAMPPDPRNDIGNFSTWGELLAAHELVHVAHLTRPSRNPFVRALWRSLPVNVGPIARKAPRWVYEGYATALEGRITGTGRPNNTWRPAILRQWAIEGRLPTYGQLDFSDAFGGGEFAYLGGSAFLEWLMHREGDSSLVHVWRRMTARTVRSFESAFVGVYGDAPAQLYGRHVAELTRDAMAAKSALERAGLVEGELVQRLSWNTGDPAVSPNGEHVAITLRDRDRPSRIVIWKTAAEPEDTAMIRRRIQAQTLDPIDVPSRRFYPVARKPVKTLAALNGRSFQQPRWFADNRRVLVTRWTPRADGSVSPDLFVWDTESDETKRITRGSSVLHGDPGPDGTDAVAMQCHWGHCDIARVDLARGAMTTLLEGNAELSYYRPRYSPDGRQIAASVSENGRWRVVVADRAGQRMRYVDPDTERANRYDPEWLGTDALVVVSELGGVANLELIELSSGRSQTLTRVTGAAVGPSVNRADSSIWFLNLHALGYDVRRLPRGRSSDSVVSIDATAFGFAAPKTPHLVTIGRNSVGPARPYGSGPRHQRWLPGAYASAEGAGVFLGAFTGDIVGRLNATVMGAYGERGTWNGGSLRATWRYPRPAVEVGVHGVIQEPSRGRDPQPAADSVDATLFQSLLAVSGQRLGDGWMVRARGGGAAGTLASSRSGETMFRGLGFAELELQFHQARGARGILERLRVHSSQGHSGAPYQRLRGALEVVTTGRDMMPLELGVTYGRMVGSPHVFERFAVGGVASPVGDSSLLSQRYAMPMLPTAIDTGSTLFGWRVALPSSAWTMYFEGVSTSSDAYIFRKWNRAVGIDMTYSFPPVPVAFTPRFQARTGVGYTLDAPFRKKVRAFLEMRMEP